MPSPTLLLPSFLALMLAGCGGDGPSEADSTGRDADTGEPVALCGAPVSSSSLDSFDYRVDDLAGCNDIQEYPLQFDWSYGPGVVVEGAISSGTVSVRASGEGGEVSEMTVDAVHPGATLGQLYTDCAALEAGVGPSSITIRLLFSDAVGSLVVRSDAETYSTSTAYFDEMCSDTGGGALDEDGDGYAGGDGEEGDGGGDCNDADPAINPGAEEVWYDGLDQDCDGADDYDQDADGFDAYFSNSDAESGRDCNDQDADVFPGGQPEFPNNGEDDDCDGRIDEEWSGVDVLYSDNVDATEILTFDSIGRIAAVVPIGGGCHPVALDHLGSGWVTVNDDNTVGLVDATGECVVIADFSDATSYPGGATAVSTSSVPEIYVTTGDALWTVSLDGTLTERSRWSTGDLSVVAIAVDLLTGDVGLFGAYGGVGLWDADSGTADILRADDPTAELALLAATYRDGGGWYSLGVDTDGIVSTYLFDPDTEEWSALESWYQLDWIGQALVVDCDREDYYVSVNDGEAHAVLRVVGGTGFVGTFYATEGAASGREFLGMIADY